MRKLVYQFLSNWNGYDRGDSFPFDFEPNSNPFGSKSKEKLSLRLYTRLLFQIHWENSYYISFQIEWDMIVVTVFLSILNQMEFYLVQNRKKNCHYDYIPFNLKGNGILVFSVEVRNTSCIDYLYAVPRALTSQKAITTCSEEHQ